MNLAAIARPSAWLVIAVLSCAIPITNQATAADPIDPCFRPGSKSTKNFKDFAKGFLESHCVDCHSGS
ncbi:MAG: hypothetical protein AAF394_17720, partial [Planctomycetota bacterium]